jgi:ketosteroid isomerase-like protein
MSQENVERILSAAEGLNRGDIDATLDGLDKDVVFEPQAGQMEGTFEGREAVKAFFTGMVDIYEVITVDYSDVRDLGDRILALGTLHTIGKGSGISTEWTLAIVATWRDGLCTHWKDYGDTEQALEAAGLSE